MNGHMITILSAITSVSMICKSQANTNREDLMAAALTSIIETFYLQRSTNVFVTSSKTDATHNAILRKVFGTLDKNASSTWILHDSEYLNGNRERFSNIILIDSHDALGSILESVTNTSLEHFGFYTVAITNFDERSDLNNSLVDTFSVFWRHMILDVHKNKSLLVHTYFPFAPTHCNQIVPVIWNVFKNGHFLEMELFPSKTENLFQCPIPILVAQFRPYIYVTRNHSDGSHDFDGFEYNLLCELAKKLNFRSNMSVFWDEDTTDVWDMIIDRDYDMLVGGFFFTPTDEDTLSSTKSYLSDNILVVIPNPRLYSSFETLFFPFTLTMWIFLSVTLAVAGIAIKLLRCYGKEYYEFVVGARNPTPYFSLIRVLLTGGTFYTPNGSVARFILMVWLLMCYVLQTVYQGQLFNFMRTNATVASVKTMEELIEKRISIKLINDSYMGFFEDDYDRMEKLLIFVNGSTAWEFVTETEAYVSMEIHLIDAVRREKPETRPKTIKLLLAPHVIDLPKRFYLKDAMDDLISYMNENGLTSKWTAPYKESEIRDNVDKRIPQKLHILQILGVVEVCLGGLIFSMLVFALEVLSPRLGYWKNDEKILSGDPRAKRFEESVHSYTVFSV